VDHAFGGQFCVEEAGKEKEDEKIKKRLNQRRERSTISGYRKRGRKRLSHKVRESGKREG